MASHQQKSILQRRRTAVIMAALGAMVLFLAVFSQQAFNLTFLRPDTFGQTLTFAALSALIFLLLVTLLFILLRNLLKIYAERRIGVLGSRFRTRLMVGALLLSFTPVLMLFLFAYGLMNRSIEKWFSYPVQELREDSARVAELLTAYARQNAQAEAEALAASAEVRKAFAAGEARELRQQFLRHAPGLQGGFVMAVSRDAELASFRAPAPWAQLKQSLLERAAGQGKDPNLPPAVLLKNTEYLLGAANLDGNGRVIVGMPLPADFTQALRHIEESQRRYQELSQSRKLVRQTYMLLLLLLTVLVLFAAMWLSLYLAKSVTRPVAALAEATQEISRGHLDYRVQFAAEDELGELVRSFNTMTAELENSRMQLDQRRGQIETILESIPTGVLSLDATRRVTHINASFTRIFGLRREPSPAAEDASRLSFISKDGNGNGSRPTFALEDLFPDDVVADLTALMRRADRMGSASAQMDLPAGRTKINVAITVASLRHEGQRLGYVMVFEDFSELLKAQKQSAWSEVARRVAHEIKNPLTPIALSAERIRRHLERAAKPDDQSLAVIHGAAQTIQGAVETVRTLVDEFSTLARFPASQPQLADINHVIESALLMFAGRLDGVRIYTDLSPNLPHVHADVEGMRRVVANLVDNAAEAMQESLVKEIRVSTAMVPTHDAVEITVADTGHGVTHEMKEKLFLPYFSTRQRGTGLGLAIVSRIIEEHHGSIRVEEGKPVGAKFIVELPVKIHAGTEPQHA